MGEPVIHHRSADFREILERCLGRLRDVCRTESDVLLFTASGTGAMESVVANVCAPGDRVLVVSAGYFGERWAQLAATYGCAVETLDYEWGETPAAEDLRARLEELDGVKVVFLTHSETSTGVVADLQALAGPARETGALVAVDAVSSLGAVPVETDAWGLDAVASGSQKALMTPPGLALVAVSDAAAAAARRNERRAFYFDWERTHSAQAKLDAAYTPAVSLVRAIDVALGLLLQGGLETAFEHHRKLGRACREGLKAMGLELFSPDEDRSAVVTTVRAPDELDVAAFLLDLRDRLGVQLIGGQGEWKGKVFRIGHIGYFDIFDITTALAAVELALAELGADVERGVAVSRALDTYASAARV